MAEMAQEGFGGGREGAGGDLARFRAGIGAGGVANPYTVLLGFDPMDGAALIRRVEEGLPYGSLERFRGNVGLSREAVAELVGIRPRTLDRRKNEGRLRPGESDRLLRAARVFGKVLALFEGDAGAAGAWLRSPRGALGGAAPLEMAKTEVGAREVESLVGRLEHGVFS